jgi:4-amino-4-deoxy-L-arabinose transferase-like glycosyltransferase
MDSTVTTPIPPTRRSASRITRIGWVLVVMAFAAYGVLLARHVGAYAGGSDSSGYMNHARLLALGRVHVAPRTIPGLAPTDVPDWLYSALGFRVASDGTGLVPTYPAGLPLWILAAAKVVGWAQAGNLVLWLHAMAGVGLTYAAARAFGLGQRASIVAAVVVAGSPVYLFMALQAMSDVPALVWTTAAVVAACRARERWRWAFAAGAAYGMAVLVRPTNALALVPIAIALSWPPAANGPRPTGEPVLAFLARRWLAFGAGGLPCAILFALHSHAAYGKFITTGYGDSAGLEWQWVGMTWRHYAHWLPLEFTPVVVAIVALPLLVRRQAREVVILGTWVMVFAGFYSAYSCTHETWWYLRFLLPAAPALVIGALLVLQSWLRPRIPARVASLALCTAVVGAIAFDAHWDQKLFALDSGDGEKTYPTTAAWLQQHLPPNAVVAVMQNSGALFYYTDFVFVRWDALDPTSFAKVAAALKASGRPLYAALFPFEIDDQHAFRDHMPQGTWAKIGSVREVTIWRWSPDGAP